MGWWGTGVMSGDGPLDDKGDLFDLAGVKYEPGDESNLTAEVLNKASAKIFKKFSKQSYQPEISLQVLAVMIMQVGAKMPQYMKKAFIRAANKDEWAREDESSRITEMVRLMRRIVAYPEHGGLKVEWDEPGLMLTMGATIHGEREKVEEMRKEIRQEMPGYEEPDTEHTAWDVESLEHEAKKALAKV